MDQEKSSAFFAELLVEFPQYQNIGAITPDGYAFASGIPLKDKLYLGDRTYFINALSSKQFAAGEYQISRLSGVPNIVFAYPVFAVSRPKIILTAALNLKWLIQFMENFNFPDCSSMTLLDKNNTVLAHYPENQYRIGDSISESIYSEFIMDNGGSDFFIATDPDGIKCFYVYTPLFHTGSSRRLSGAGKNQRGNI